ncbi:SDR family NAD(P)-dependent oxidoreductase [Nonomuraea wenchangensis]
MERDGWAPPRWAAGQAQTVRGLGASVEAVQADLATHDGVERLYERVTAGGRPLSAVAINAGIGAGGPFAETDLAGDLEVVDLNVRSAVHLAKLCLRDMVPRREGRVLFTSSIAATQPGPFEALMKGEAQVVAGSFMNKAMAGAAKVMPEKAKAAAHRRMAEPGSGDH